MVSLGESLDTWRKERRPRRCSLRSRDQSLPPNGGLHPHALRSCYSFEPPALASRSRFVVTREICSSLKQLQSGCGSRSRPTGVTATSCFVCFVCVFPHASKGIRRHFIYVSQKRILNLSQAQSKIYSASTLSSARISTPLRRLILIFPAFVHISTSASKSSSFPAFSVEYITIEEYGSV